MSQLAQFSQFNLQMPFQVSDDFETLVNRLAEDGIHFENIPLVSVIPKSNLNHSELLELYDEQVERIKIRGGYQCADIASIRSGDAFSVSIRDRYLSEHCHEEDEVRFFIEGSVLVYIHINERIHIVQCGMGDFIVIPAGVKHWLDIGPNPAFTSIRWYNNKTSLDNNYTGSYVAESTPRWETIYDEQHFKR